MTVQLLTRKQTQEEKMNQLQRILNQSRIKLKKLPKSSGLLSTMSIKQLKERAKELESKIK